MIRKMFAVLVVLAVSGKVFATGVDVILNDTSGASAFTIKNSNSVEVAHIASDGGMQLASPESGGNLIWKANKAAFRAGTVDGTQWDDANIGFLSIGIGYDALASKLGSVAMGDGPTASGASAVAMGYKTTASGDNSFAMGASSIASGTRAVAMGYQSTASGNLSIAMGDSSTAEGDSSVAIGVGAVASGQKSFAIGENVTAGQSGVSNSYAIGRNVSATVSNSFVIGVGTGSPLVNNIQNSLMVGFNSTAPMLFVDGNHVGINTSSPSYTLDVAGDINVTGDVRKGGAAYTNPFTGHHRFPDSALVGNIQTGDAVILDNGKILRSNQPKDKRVIGIYTARVQLQFQSNSEWVHLVAGLGDSTDEDKANGTKLAGFNVCSEGGPIQSGDLLTTSSRPGYLMKQDDDIIHSYTVGKAGESANFNSEGLDNELYGFIYSGG